MGPRADSNCAVNRMLFEDNEGSQDLQSEDGWLAWSVPPQHGMAAAATEGELLSGNAIGALAIVAFGGGDLEMHFALDCPAQKATHRVWLPFGRLGDFL